MSFLNRAVNVVVELIDKIVVTSRVKILAIEPSDINNEELYHLATKIEQTRILGYGRDFDESKYFSHNFFSIHSDVFFINSDVFSMEKTLPHILSNINTSYPPKPVVMLSIYDRDEQVTPIEVAYDILYA